MGRKCVIFTPGILRFPEVNQYFEEIRNVKAQGYPDVLTLGPQEILSRLREGKIDGSVIVFASGANPEGLSQFLSSFREAVSSIKGPKKPLASVAVFYPDVVPSDMLLKTIQEHGVGGYPLAEFRKHADALIEWLRNLPEEGSASQRPGVSEKVRKETPQKEPIVGPSTQPEASQTAKTDEEIEIVEPTEKTQTPAPPAEAKPSVHKPQRGFPSLPRKPSPEGPITPAEKAAPIPPAPAREPSRVMVVSLMDYPIYAFGVPADHPDFQRGAEDGFLGQLRKSKVAGAEFFDREMVLRLPLQHERAVITLFGPDTSIFSGLIQQANGILVALDSLALIPMARLVLSEAGKSGIPTVCLVYDKIGVGIAAEFAGIDSIRFERVGRNVFDNAYQYGVAVGREAANLLLRVVMQKV